MVDVVILTMPPDTVRFPDICASSPTRRVGALTVWDTNRFPKTLLVSVTVRFEVSTSDALNVTVVRWVTVRLEVSMLDVLRV